MATMAAEPVFVDTNVLIYAALQRSERHASSVRLLDVAADEGARIWLSRQVLREYLAATTRPQGGDAPLTMQEAVVEIRSYERRFAIAEDGPAVTGQLLSLLLRYPTAGRQVHDANIVATMLAHGVRRLLTFNAADFRRYAGEIVIEPAP